MITITASEATPATIRRAEKDSIQQFLEGCGEFFSGLVLDFGCGRQPYRNLVESFGARYYPYDRKQFPANTSGESVGSKSPLSMTWDVILITQVVQYQDDLWADLYDCWSAFERADAGFLVMTYPTCWDEVEPEDHWRFTKTGMETLLTSIGFREIVRHERRAEVDCQGFKFPLGYGVVARA